MLVPERSTHGDKAEDTGGLRNMEAEKKKEKKAEDNDTASPLGIGGCWGGGGWGGGGGGKMGRGGEGNLVSTLL